MEPVQSTTHSQLYITTICTSKQQRASLNLQDYDCELIAIRKVSIMTRLEERVDAFDRLAGYCATFPGGVATPTCPQDDK